MEVEEEKVGWEEAEGEEEELWAAAASLKFLTFILCSFSRSCYVIFFQVCCGFGPTS